MGRDILSGYDDAIHGMALVDSDVFADASFQPGDACHSRFEGRSEEVLHTGQQYYDQDVQHVSKLCTD